MIKRNCKLTRASRYYMGGGGGGGSDILMRQPSQEKKNIKNWYNFNENQYFKFRERDPLLNAATQGALGFWEGLPAMLAQYPGFQKELSGYQGQIGDYQKQLQGISGGIGGLLDQIPGLQNQLGGFIGQLPGLSNQLGALYGRAQDQIGANRGNLAGLYNQVGGLANPFRQYLGPQSALTEALHETINPTLRTGGALTAQQGRDISQQTRAIASAQGNARSVGALGNELLNRDAYREQRFNQALAQSQGVLGQQAGATGALQNIFNQQAGITGQQAGLTGLLSQIGQGVLGQKAGLLGLGGQLTGQQGNLLGLGGNLLGQQAGIAGQGAGLSALGAGLTGQKAGLLGQQQALQTGGLNQLLGVGNAGVSQFTGLTNPILGYLGNLFGGNQQASIAQAQINAQQQAAGDAKMGSTIGGGISAIGSILPLLFMSDERIKTKVKSTGEKLHGVPEKTFEYKTDPEKKRFTGFMAKDVQKKFPWLVVTEPMSGLKMVGSEFMPKEEVA